MATCTGNAHLYVTLHQEPYIEHPWLHPRYSRSSTIFHGVEGSIMTIRHNVPRGRPGWASSIILNVRLDYKYYNVHMDKYGAPKGTWWKNWKLFTWARNSFYVTTSRAHVELLRAHVKGITHTFRGSVDKAYPMHSRNRQKLSREARIVIHVYYIDLSGNAFPLASQDPGTSPGPFNAMPEWVCGNVAGGGIW